MCAHFNVFAQKDLCLEVFIVNWKVRVFKIPACVDTNPNDGNVNITWIID